MSKEQRLRKAIRNEIKTVLKEDNILVKAFTKILDNLHGKAKKRAIKRFISTPEVQRILKAKKPAADAFEKAMKDL
mgnify:CR=1 FL=1